MNKLILAISILCCGCATSPPRIVTQTVAIPTPVLCQQVIPTPPAYCFPQLKQTDNVFTKTRCLLSDRALSLGYELELLTKLKACE